MLMFSVVRILLAIQCIKIFQIIIFSFTSKKRVKVVEDDREEFGFFVWWRFFFLYLSV